MINWIRSLLDRRSRSELLDQIAAQQDCINMLLGKPVQQLAKLARGYVLSARAVPDEVLRVRMFQFIYTNIDVLRCLDDVEIPEKGKQNA